MTKWDEEVDLLVAGTGAAGMVAAITAAHEGLDVVLVESTDRWGGTTSISGGGLWMPGHPGMKDIGKTDSRDDILAYMQAAIGDPTPASSVARREAYVDAIPGAYRMLEHLGMRWAPSKDYPDYYPDREGGMAGGRAIETHVFTTGKLGKYWKKSRVSEQMPPIPIKTDDVWLMARAWSTFQGFVRGAVFVFRALWGLITFRLRTGLGGAYAGRLMEIVRRHEIPVWLESPITELVKDKGAVVGAVVDTPAGPKRVRTRKGVVLGTGGFARNAEWRKKHHGIEGYTSAPVGDVGSGIQVGIDAGADIALMDDAWWGASVMMPDGADPQFLVAERSMPHSIMVDQAGHRFTNESASYIDVGHDILERDKTSPAIPCWLVLDKRHRQRYLFNAFLSGTKKLKQQGLMVEARTVRELAEKMGADPDVFEATVERFNGFAAKGVDEDFDRGRTAYDNYYGDPTRNENPNLGVINKGPFQAVKVVPGDLGTKGGILTDEYGRALDKKGKVIAGLYASGNASASVMGNTYPGAGSTIGPATVFGYLAARHAAGVE